MTEEIKQAEAPLAETTAVEEVKQTEVKAEETKTEEAKTEEVQETKEAKQEPDDEDRKKPSGSERLKRQKQRLAAELAEERARREELERRVSGEKTEGKPGIDREPREDDFPNDYFAFERAKTAWEVRQAIRAERDHDERTRRQAQTVEARMELVDEYAEHLDTVRERIPDYDQVVAKANVKIPDELADEILSAGSKGPLISYYLAQNPDKLAQLLNMTGKALAREVGRIEARVHLPQAKKATEASPPPSQVKGGAAPAFDPFKTDDMDAYVKWRSAGGGKASH